MWTSESCFLVGGSVVSRISECFLQGRSHLTVPVGVVAVMAKSEEVYFIVNLNSFNNGACLGVYGKETLFVN